MIKLASFANSFVKNTVGTINGKPRMYNVDRDVYLVGYAEVNKMATTAFSRISVNKGWFYCDPSLIQEGDLLQDKADGKFYLAMSLKMEVLSGESVYMDGTLYLCDSTATVQRWVEGARDSFGRPAVATPTTIYSDVYIMTAPSNFDVMEQQDRLIAQNKIKIHLQSKFDVKPADRIVTSKGKTYKVISIDDVSLRNIIICFVDEDVR